MSDFFDRLAESRFAQIAVGLLVGVLIIGGLIFADGVNFNANPSEPPLLPSEGQAIATRPATAPPAPTPTLNDPEIALAEAASPAPPTPLIPRATYALPEAAADETIVDLPADARRVGWVNNDPFAITDASFPDFNIYAGTLRVFDGTLRDVTYTGAAAFDLTLLDEYGPARRAELVIFGLNEENQELDDGTWTIEILADDRAFWNNPTFDTLNRAPAARVLVELDASQIGYNEAVRVPLEPHVVDLLNGLRYQIKSLTLRVRGPDRPDSLFGFDGGLGTGSLGNPPRLLISAGPLEATPTPIVVTPTPTPANVETEAARVIEATRLVESVGTPTPTPYNIVTATPSEKDGVSFWIDPQGTPLPIWVATATPENEETAVALERRATAAAIATGTPTPWPERFVTATPTHTPIYYIATVTPENVMTLAVELVALTAVAQAQGTPTPLPTNAVIITPTPRFIVVTSTPTPLNIATAAILSAEATVHAIVTGSPTPTPYNQVTATPLPALIPVSFFTPTPTASPTRALPGQMPPIYSGKILFRSDRAGKDPVTGEDYRVFAIDPADGSIYSVTEPWVLELAQQQLGLSPDGAFEAQVKPDNNQVLQIQIYSFQYGDTRQVTTFTGAPSYDPAWSPTGDRIAFVGTEPGNDEIYTIRTDGSEQVRLTTNTWEWDKHPSWSPDGTRIVFWSNRESGRRQLWIMNADGTGQFNLSNNDYNDWDPYWIR